MIKLIQTVMIRNIVILYLLFKNKDGKVKVETVSKENQAGPTKIYSRTGRRRSSIAVQGVDKASPTKLTAKISKLIRSEIK